MPVQDPSASATLTGDLPSTAPFADPSTGGPPTTTDPSSGSDPSTDASVSEAESSASNVESGGAATTDGATTSTGSTDDETTAPPPDPVPCGPLTIFCEDFPYEKGLLPYGPDWFADDALKDPVMTIVTPGLLFPSHPGSGVGNAVLLALPSQQAPRVQFPLLDSDRLFVAFTANVKPNGPAFWRRLMSFAHGIDGLRCGTLVVQSNRTVGGDGNALALGLELTYTLSVDVASSYVMIPSVTYTIVYEKDMTKHLMRVYLIPPGAPILIAPPAPLLQAAYACDNLSDGIGLGNRGYVSLGETPAVLADGLRTTVDGIRVATTWQGLWAMN